MKPRLLLQFIALVLILLFATAAKQQTEFQKWFDQGCSLSQKKVSTIKAADCYKKSLRN